MCLAIPGQVLSFDGDIARVSVNGVICEAGIALAEDVAVGDYVIVHAGFILQKLAAEEAAQEIEAIREAVHPLGGDAPGGNPPGGAVKSPSDGNPSGGA